MALLCGEILDLMDLRFCTRPRDHAGAHLHDTDKADAGSMGFILSGRNRLPPGALVVSPRFFHDLHAHLDVAWDERCPICNERFYDSDLGDDDGEA